MFASLPLLLYFLLLSPTPNFSLSSFLFFPLSFYEEKRSMLWVTCQHRNFLIWEPDVIMGFPGDSVVKNLPANARDAREASLIPEWGR